MSPPRVFFKLKGDLTVGTRVPLTRTDSHHIVNVLRLEIGEEIVLASPHGEGEFVATLVSIDLPVIVEIKGTADNKKEGLSIVKTVFVALLKGGHTDLVIEKATELGVERIVIYGAERSVPKISAEALPEKAERWCKIAEAAAKQCQRSSLPELNWCSNIEELTTTIPKVSDSSDICLLASLAKDAKHPRELRPPTGFAHLLIGPEGDLSAGEHSALIMNGFIPISLGKNVLRAETAAIAGVAALNLLWSK